MYKLYEKAIRYAADAGLTNLSNYMLYNFKDSPVDLYKRMRLNIELNEKLNITIILYQHWDIWVCLVLSGLLIT